MVLKSVCMWGGGGGLRAIHITLHLLVFNANLAAELRRCRNMQRDEYVGSLGSLMGVGELDLTPTCVANLIGCH